MRGDGEPGSRRSESETATRSTSSIVDLGVSSRGAAVGLLADAFGSYPVMRHVLGEPLEGAVTSASYPERLQALVGFFCDKRLTRGWPVMGLCEGGQLHAVALVTPPGGGSRGAEAERDRLLAAVGPEALARLDHYEEATDLDAPRRPHHTLGVIGTRPERQGRGDGSRLLEAVVARAVAEPQSAGVYLNTEIERNVAFYRRHGFDIVGRRRVGAMRSWCLFRCRDAS